MVEAARRYRPAHPVFEPTTRRPLHGTAAAPRVGLSGLAPDLAELDPSLIDLSLIDEMAATLGPSGQAIFGLYVACRLKGEHYAECFARLGAPTYAAMLHQALLALLEIAE